MEVGFATFIRQFWQENFKRFWSEISLEIYFGACKKVVSNLRLYRFSIQLGHWRCIVLLNG